MHACACTQHHAHVTARRTCFDVLGRAVRGRTTESTLMFVVVNKTRGWWEKSKRIVLI